MAQYQHKPLIVDAFQMTEKRMRDKSEWPDWVHAAWNHGPVEGGLWLTDCSPSSRKVEDGEDMVCGTPEDIVRVYRDGWLIRRAGGDIDAHSDEIFNAKYKIES